MRAFITVYMTRGQKMDRHPHNEYAADFTVLDRLARSVPGELIVATDSLTVDKVPADLRDRVTIFPAGPLPGNFFLQRWSVVRDVLDARPDLEWVYVADGRDVEVVADPWQLEPGKLYSCLEPARLNVGGRRPWVGQPLGRSGFINDRKFHRSPIVTQWIRQHRYLTALNAGVTGGDAKTVRAFAARIAEVVTHDHMAEDYTDMALYNLIAHNEFEVVADEAYIGAKCHTAAEAPDAKVLHLP